MFFHTGTPSAGIMFEPMVAAGAARGLRHVAYSRPGYARSDRRPGRTVADCAADVAAIADQLGIGRFYTVGWSGGGPHALACAALLSDRVIAAATLAACRAARRRGLGLARGHGRGERPGVCGRRLGAADRVPRPHGGRLRPGHARAASRGVRGPGLARRRRVDDGRVCAVPDRRRQAGRRQGHLGMVGRRPGDAARLGVLARRDRAAGDDLAGRPGPHGAVRSRALARRSRRRSRCAVAARRGAPVAHGRVLRARARRASWLRAA